MTVAELIEQLQQLDPAWRVYVRGYESGVNDVTQLQPGHFVRDYNDEPWEGQHQRKYDGGAAFDGVELAGSNDLAIECKP